VMGGPEALRVFAPQYSPLFWDLAEQSPEVLIASAAEWLQALAVIRAEGEEREEFFRVMREVVGRLNGLASRDKVRWHGLMWFVLAWALQRRPLEEREALIALAQAAQEDVLRRGEVRAMSQTIADALREEGKIEGALQFAQETLIGVLREKFGRVPKALQRQIKVTTDIARLKAGVYQVVRVNSLDDFQL
jgi:hypothetical protein